MWSLWLTSFLKHVYSRFMHTVGGVSTSFLSIVISLYVYWVVFTFWLSGTMLLWTPVDNFCVGVLSFLLGICLQVEIRHHEGTLCLTIETILQSISNILYLYQKVIRFLISPHPHQHLLLLFNFLNDSHLSVCEIILTIVLTCFSQWLMMLNIFSHAYEPLVFFLEGMSVQIDLAHFKLDFPLLLNCNHSFYILYTSPLSDIWELFPHYFLNFFSSASPTQLTATFFTALIFTKHF